MVSESVYVSLTFDSIKVYTKFWMYNKGETQKIKVFFPYSTEVFGLKGPPEIKDMTCKINQKTIKVKKKDRKIISDYKYTMPYFYWTTEFIGNDTTEVEVTYNSVWGRDGFAPCKYFDYIIGTAKTWNGPIGRGIIIFDHTNYLSTNFIYKCAFEANFKEPYYLFTEQKINPDIQIEYKEDATIYSFHDYTPKANEGISISILDYDWINTYEYVDYFKKLFVCQNYTKEQFGDMKNEIYARRGYIFQDKKLMDYFLMKKWYKPKDKITVDDLSEGEKGFIKVLSELEQEHK